MKPIDTVLLFEEIQNRGLSVAKFANQAGIPPDRVYRWQRRRGKPKAEDVVKIQEWLEKVPGNVSHNTPIADKAKAYDALFPVLIADYAAWKGQQTGENPEVIARKLYKAAEDVQRLNG